MKITFYRPSLWNLASDCSKWAINWKNDNDVTIFRLGIIVNFLWCCRVSLVKFSCWTKFHVNIITGSRVITIFLYKGLTRNPETGNTLFWDKLGIPNLARIVSNKMLLNAAKCQGCSFYRFWVIKGKPTEVGKITPTPTQIRVKT